jgi:hypothetical protein
MLCWPQIQHNYHAHLCRCRWPAVSPPPSGSGPRREPDAEGGGVYKAAIHEIIPHYCTIVQNLIPRLGFSNSRQVLNFCMWNFV